jgi:hypothetical protein
MLGARDLPDPKKQSFEVVEATIPDMQRAMQQRRTTSRDLVLQYLTRIALYEDRLNAAIVINKDALKEAEQLDRERAAGKLRGPLHGIPIALKDNIHTLNMPTTGGALAFADFTPSYEATITKNLRDAGAIIIAKTGMTELANWVASGMPTNYNAIQGYGMNPYDPRRDPREAYADGRPVLATGGSMVHTIELLTARGAQDITVVCVVCAPEGVAALEKAAPRARLFTAAVDDGLNDIAYIVPGLGDAGDRQFGPR